MLKAPLFISRLSKLFSWLDLHVMFLWAVLLAFFIPIWPKIPLAEIIPGYLVRVRLEDFLILGAALTWVLQVIRKKVAWRSPLSFLISFYLLVGLLSSISAMFWTKTVPLNEPHVVKLFAHWVRRIQYFSLFFVVFAAIKTKKQLMIILFTFVLATGVVGVYGVGQKYLYWPVYSTMNREFSKGLRLYLTENARVQSTFGGHYDFAAYLVIALPLLLVLIGLSSDRRVQVGVWLIFAVGLWGMIMTSSRSSFLAYIGSLMLLYPLMFRRWGWRSSLASFILVAGLTTGYLFLFGTMLERFAQLFRGNARFDAIQKVVEDTRSAVQTPIVDAPQNAISVDDVQKASEMASKQFADELKKVTDASDTRPTPANQELPPDVTEDIPDRVVSEINEYGEEVQVVIPRVFSDNAHLLGLSAAIRLDTLWPFAIRGFLMNPLFGSGYSTLTKYSIQQFTEAESTDNDFLRTLGETGLLGFLSFYGVMVVASWYLWKIAQQHKTDSLAYPIAALYTVVTFGLMINAIYIDVFVASKVIQPYWILTGALIGYAVHLNASSRSDQTVRSTGIVASKKMHHKNTIKSGRSLQKKA